MNARLMREVSSVKCEGETPKQKSKNVNRQNRFALDSQAGS